MRSSSSAPEVASTAIWSCPVLCRTTHSLHAPAGAAVSSALGSTVATEFVARRTGATWLKVRWPLNYDNLQTRQHVCRSMSLLWNSLPIYESCLVLASSDHASQTTPHARARLRQEPQGETFAHKRAHKAGVCVFCVREPHSVPVSGQACEL